MRTRDFTAGLGLAIGSLVSIANGVSPEEGRTMADLVQLPLSVTGGLYLTGAAIDYCLYRGKSKASEARDSPTSR